MSRTIFFEEAPNLVATFQEVTICCVPCLGVGSKDGRLCWTGYVLLGKLHRSCAEFQACFGRHEVAEDEETLLLELLDLFE